MPCQVKNVCVCVYIYIYIVVIKENVKLLGMHDFSKENNRLDDWQFLNGQKGRRSNLQY